MGQNKETGLERVARLHAAGHVKYKRLEPGKVRVSARLEAEPAVADMVKYGRIFFCPDEYRLLSFDGFNNAVHGGSRPWTVQLIFVDETWIVAKSRMRDERRGRGHIHEKK